MNPTEFKRLLFNPKVDKPSLFAQIKRDVTANAFYKLLDSSLNHPVSRNLIFANALPKSYKDIRRGRITPHSANLAGELNWNLYAIRNYSSQINQFIKYKTAYEKSFLLCNYQEAEKNLAFIEEEICKSIWSLENRFLLSEYKEGVEGNWNLLSTLAKELDDALLLFFTENLSKRAETKITYFRFRNLFVNQIADIDGPNEFKEYLCYRLNYPAYSGFESFSFFLTVESISTIVDRYLIVRDSLSEIISSNDLRKQAIAKYALGQLTSQIKDPVLTQLANFLGEGEIDNKVDENAFLILDLYTKGKYEKCLELLPDILREQPSNVELYEVYTKCLLELRMSFIASNVSPFIDQILENLYNIFSRDAKSEESMDLLLKTISSFISTNWAKQLLSLISSLGSPKQNPSYQFLFFFYSSIVNPRVLNVLQSDSTTYLKTISYFEKYQIDNSAYLVNKWISGGDLESIKQDENISSFRKDLYLGRIFMKNRDFAGAITHYNKILERPLSTTAYEEAIENLFNAYVNIALLGSAAELFVSNYLKNSLLVTRCDKDKLVALIQNVSFAGVERIIDLPIFFKIATSDPYVQYVAYDVFLDFYKVQRPVELLQYQDQFTKEKLTYFLKEVCTSEVLQHSYLFEGSDDLEKERLNILRHLLLLDKDNETIYIREITEISQASIIRKAIQEVNKGRITVNIPQLKNKETANIKEGFNRYQELSNYSKNKDVVAIDTSSKLINEYLTSLNEERVKNKIVFTNDPAYITFKVMFLELRDQFILSKEYGLDGYLSTRIRHGTLLNHIRSVFESLNLVSQKGSDNNYRDNEYWTTRLPFQLLEKHEAIQIAIKRFSQKIDEFTEYLIRELVQIKTEKYQKKPNGLFDYSISQVELANIFGLVRDKIKDYEGFLNFTFEFLEGKSELLLKSIRHEFNSSIKDRYNELIIDFQNEIKQVLRDSSFVDLTSSIAKSSTYIQNELTNISEWFYLSNPTTDLTLDLNTIVQSSLEITNSIYPNNKIRPLSINIDFDYPIIGAINLIYIVKILMDNIIIHSGLTGEQKEVEISSKYSSKSISLVFRNRLSDTVDIEALKDKLNKVKQDWDDKSDDYDKLNVEGGSGFRKIRKILALDMSRRDYSFNFEIHNERLEIVISFNVEFKDNERENSFDRG